MQRSLAILLNIVLLLPSIGLHIDLTHCCGDLENIGISHNVNLNVSECCDPEPAMACRSNSEIQIPPLHLDFISVETAHISAVALHAEQTTEKQILHTQQSYTCYSILPIPELRPRHQSEFQVFLC